MRLCSIVGSLSRTAVVMATGADSQFFQIVVRVVEDLLSWWVCDDMAHRLIICTVDGPRSHLLHRLAS
jgi:hypothetical protein